MTPDVVVIGAGMYGVAAALVAEAAGATVCMIDGGEQAHKASTAASGYFTPKWFAKANAQEQAYRARERAEALGVRFRATGSLVCSYGAKPPAYRSGLETFYPSQALGLRKPDIVGRVRRIDQRARHVAMEDGTLLPFVRGVIVAVGVATDLLLGVSELPGVGVSGLQGSGVILCDTPPPDVPIWQEIGPYRQYAIREWGDGRTRVCATLETHRNRHQEYVEKMMAAVDRHLAPGKRIVEVLVGSRPMLEAGPQAIRVADGVVATTGGGRIGAIYSFWCAEEACRLIGVQ